MRKKTTLLICTCNRILKQNFPVISVLAEALELRMNIVKYPYILKSLVTCPGVTKNGSRNP